MKTPEKQTSKLVSYWLRHNPSDAVLVVDDFGWVSADDLIRALQSRDIRIDFAELLLLTKSFDKVRWEIDEINHKIRATHGHSFPVLLDEKEKIPPATLYHGTALKNMPAILEQGILPMSRQFVHLSETEDTAKNIGSRHGKPVIIEVHTNRLINDGWKFYQTSDHVWLTSAIPVEYLKFRN